MAEPESRPYRMELDLGDDESPSRWWIVLITLGGLGLLSCICLCGFGLYFFRPVFRHDPDHVRSMTGEMLSITLPASWEPGGTIEWNVLWLATFRGAYYQWPEAQGQLAFVEVEGQLLDQQGVRSHVVRQLQETGGSGAFVVESEEARQLSLNGQSVTFQFQEGRELTTEVPIKLVEGVVPGRRGPVLVALRMKKTAWDEQEILDMLESIRMQSPMSN